MNSDLSANSPSFPAQALLVVTSLTTCGESFMLSKAYPDKPLCQYILFNSLECNIRIPGFPYGIAPNLDILPYQRLKNALEVLNHFPGDETAKAILTALD